MEKRSTSKRICSFCGKERDITIIKNDGMDYMGHQRGRVDSRTIDNGCDCELGKIEHKKTAIKQMCLNCKYYDGLCCNNEQELAEVSDLFDVGSKLQVKKNTRKCKYWELNSEIFKKLLEKSEVQTC